MTPHSPSSEHESLSALFDGELPADEARFALRRLGHDEQWRQSCERWQLVGDVLRRQAVAPAPHDFAARVRAAVALETMESAAPMAVGERPAWRSRPWVGGAALAASVAVAALFVSRPLGPATAPPPAPVAQTPPVPASAERSGAFGGMSPATTAPPSALASVPGASSLAPPASAARPVAPAGGPVLPRGFAGGPAQGPVGSVAAGAAPPLLAATPDDPFGLASGEVATRPWPRPTMPAPSAGAFTVRYGRGAVASPSFYPFEPRLPAEAALPSEAAGGGDPEADSPPTP